MRRVFIIVLTLFVAGAAGAQMKKAQPPRARGDVKPLEVVKPTSLDQARRITRNEAMKLVAQDKAVYVDIRSKASYDTGHIKGALSIPGSQLMTRLKELPPGKMIITYCACEKESTAARAVLQLNAHGMRNAAALMGGWHEWTALGLPTAK